MFEYLNKPAADESIPDIRIAVLIDAENVPCSYVKSMMEEIARYGNPTIRRIYADWTSPCVSSWKGVLLENAITPIQQYSYTHGKNSTDSAMIIDAMDLLYSNKVDTFCIVSSDSDFTRLATRLREAGKHVIGIGEQKTPNAFIVGCDRFIFLEILAPEMKKKTAKQTVSRHKQQAKKKDALPEKLPETKDASEPLAEPSAESLAEPSAEMAETVAKAASKSAIPEEVIDLLVSSVTDIADEDGWAFLGEIGNLLLKKQPSFDSRNFGFQKLTPLFAATGLFEIDKRQTSNPSIKHMYIRVK